MNGGGRSVLIWGRTRRTLLVDKGKPLSGDKGTRTDKQGPKIRQGKCHAYEQTYTRTNMVEVNLDAQ